MRENNEDFFYLNEKLGLLVVADGMGGHASGETASRLAVQALQDYFQGNRHQIAKADASCSETTQRLGASIQHANRVVYDAAKTSPTLNGMGTTIAAVALKGNRLSIAHIGDSRVYLIRSGSISQLTDDHSFVQEQVRQEQLSADEAAQSGLKNILTRALGIDAETTADTSELTVLDSDILLLCSDGLYNMVPDGKMMAIISRATDAAAACKTLIDAANAGGGKDNISVIVGYVRKEKWYSAWLKISRRFSEVKNG